MAANPSPLIIFNLALGIVAGYVMHRADFCIAGMFRDMFLFRRFTMLRSLLLLVMASMVLFEAARLAGLVVSYPFPLFGAPSLANVIGGSLFGVGMVLAGGCVVGTLYRIGAGNAASVVALLGMLGGSALYADLAPWWSAVVKATTVSGVGVTVPELLGIAPTGPVLLLAAGAAIPFFVWYRNGSWTRHAAAEGYLQPWKAALVLGGIGFLSVITSAMPLGITTSYAKGGGWLEALLLPGRIDRLAYFHAQPLRLAAVTPLGKLPLVGGPGPVVDALAVIQLPVIVGIVAGSVLSALMLREFRIYLKLPLRQYLSALTGGLLMGLAARMAPSCNVWHLAGGLPILAWQSILFTVGLLPGAWLGSILLTRIVA